MTFAEWYMELTMIWIKACIDSYYDPETYLYKNKAAYKEKQKEYTACY